MTTMTSISWDVTPEPLVTSPTTGLPPFMVWHYGSSFSAETRQNTEVRIHLFDH